MRISSKLLWIAYAFLLFGFALWLWDMWDVFIENEMVYLLLFPITALMGIFLALLVNPTENEIEKKSRR